MKYFVFGFVVGVVVVLMALAVTIRTAAAGFSARAEPTGVEKFLARTAGVVAIPHEAKSRANPTASTAEVVSEARAHWADHCATCHANNGSGDTEIGRRMFPRPPDMRRPETQTLSDGELFYIIQNGVRLSGMPAWGGSDHSEEDSWKLVRFIRHLPHLTAEEEQQMQRLNPKSPEDLQNEQHDPPDLSQMHHDRH